MEREQQIAAIVDAARRTRRPTSRAMWIVAGAVGAVCAIAFVVVMLIDRDPTPPGQVPSVPAGGLGFSGGLTLGLGIGIVIGFLVARRRPPLDDARHVSAHSSRSRP